jgi:alkylation response protein AidB-like acyl-CoA dehydrogenase
VELEFTDDQEELRRAIRVVLDADCPISLVREVVEKGTGVDRLWARQVELDWPALTVAAEDGGIGLSYIELTVLAEELGRAAAPGPLLATASQFVPMVRQCGNAAQRASFLTPVATQGRSGTVAIAEASGSWDPADVTTTASPDGEGWRIDGAKHWVFDGDSADEVAVVARRADTGEVEVFVVPHDGARSVAAQPLDASRSLVTLEFDGVAVGADRRLSGSDSAPQAMSTAIDRALEEATVALATETVGTCQSIFDLALQYAKDRQQFGVPIGSFQAMKHKFANMLVALEKARALAYFAAATIAEDDPRRAVAASMAKAAAGDCQQLLGQEGIQCLGGIGYTWEHDMHLYVKRVKVNDAVFGSRRIQRARVAELSGW